jgi:hypothetical protein
MALQPIDMQAMFTQSDRVSKVQANQKDGLNPQQAIVDVQIQRKAEERVLSVPETQNTGDGAERVNDRSPRKRGRKEDAGDEREEGSSGDDEAREKRYALIHDPALGRHIDVSG